MPIRHWATAMNQSAKGTVTLFNIWYDIDNERIPREVVCRFLKGINERWQETTRLSPQDQSENARKVFDEVVKANDHHESDYYFCQCQHPLKDLPGCSRVMMWKELIKHNLLDGQNGLIDDGLPLSQRQIDNISRNWKALVNRNSEMRTGRPFAWVTKTDELKRIKSRIDFDGCVSIIESLGLVHYLEYGSQEPMVEVRYPETAFDSVPVTAPTFLDSECSEKCAYRSKYSDDGWGNTVNIGNYQDGLPEAVHFAVPFNETYELETLGYLNPSSSSIDHRQFVPSDWSPSTVIDLLDKYWTNCTDFE